MIRVLPRCFKTLERLSGGDRKAFDHALRKLEQASPQEQAHMLRPVVQRKALEMDVQYALRASQKYRVLISRDGKDFIVRDVVSRGDKRYYKSE